MSRLTVNTFKLHQSCTSFTRNCMSLCSCWCCVSLESLSLLSSFSSVHIHHHDTNTAPAANNAICTTTHDTHDHMVCMYSTRRTDFSRMTRHQQKTLQNSPTSSSKQKIAPSSFFLLFFSFFVRVTWGFLFPFFFRVTWGGVHNDWERVTLPLHVPCDPKKVQSG